MSETAIPVKIVNRHLITEFEGMRYLIDTGSPSSFGKGIVPWDNESIDLDAMPTLIDIESINNHTGLGLAGLIGCDLLFKRDLTIDLPSKQLVLHDVGCPELPSMKLTDVMGIPVLQDFDVSGVPQRMCVDTGAMQSFVSESIARGLERVGTVDDFMPTGESFVADLVELEVVIGEDRHKIKAAVAPGLLTMLRAMQIDGIVGLDVLQHVPCTFSYANRCMAPVLRFA